MRIKKIFMFLAASSMLLTGCGNSKVTKNKVYWRVKMNVSELDKSLGYMFDNKIMYSVSVKDGKEEKKEINSYKVMDDGVLWVDVNYSPNLSYSSHEQKSPSYQAIGKVSKGTLEFNSGDSYPYSRYWMTESYFNSLMK